MSLLQVKDLSVHFKTDEGLVKAVNELSFDLEAGEILGVVGESGSGKSVSSLAVMGLLPKSAFVSSGEIWLEQKNILQIPRSHMRKIRGSKLAMIFQDPFTSLNPYLKISTQLLEVLEAHGGKTGLAAHRLCIELLERLGVPEAEARFYSYPHQLSGGLKQRMMIAMGLLLKPDILIADEPTTALDVTIQAQILDLLKEINQNEGTAIVLITHDLGVVAGLCDRVQVMYAGRIVESGAADPIFYETGHPYTRALLDSIPRLDSQTGTALKPIEGQPPDLKELGESCAFADRCERAQDKCFQERPRLSSGKSSSTRRACFFPLEGEEVRAKPCSGGGS